MNITLKLDENKVPTIARAVSSKPSVLPSVVEQERYIREAAAARNIDPDTAVRVAKGEGLREGVWQATGKRDGEQEPSWGPFQLLVGGEGTKFPVGLGNEFKQKTGLDPSDPQNWRQTVDFALDRAKQVGWGPWYGAKAAGITGFMGINGAPTAPPTGIAAATLPTRTAEAAIPPSSGGVGLNPSRFSGSASAFVPPASSPSLSRSGPQFGMPDLTGGAMPAYDLMIDELLSQPRRRGF